MTQAERRRLMVEGGWVVAGQILSALGVLLGLRVLTSLLSPHVFGEVVLVSGIVLMAEGLAAGPLMQAVLRYYPEAAATNRVEVLRAATMKYLNRSTLLTGVFCLIGFLLYSQFTPLSPWIGPLTVALLVVDVLRQHEITLLNSARCQRIAALWVAADVWARPILAWAMITVTGPTVMATLTGYVGASLTLLLLLAPWRIRSKVPSYKERTGGTCSASHGREWSSIQKQIELNEQQLGKCLTRYAVPLIPLGVINWITDQADRFLIGALIGAEQAGIYAALYGLVSRPFLMAGGALELWMRPVYHEALLSRSGVREKRILQVWLRAILSIGIVGTIIFGIWQEGIAALLLAEPYRVASWLMPWIAAGYGLLLIANLYGRVCYANHDTKAVFVAETTGSVASLIAAAYGVVQFGIAGAAYAVPVYFGAQLIVARVLAHRAEGRGGASVWVGERASA